MRKGEDGDVLVRDSNQPGATVSFSNQDWVRVCGVADCPEIQKVGGRVLLRNTEQPDGVVEFSEEEWEVLRKFDIGSLP